MKNSSLYYQRASLPLLRLGEKPPMEVDQLLEIYRSILSSAPRERLLALALEGKAQTEVGKRYLEWERGLRLALAVMRAEKSSRKDPPGDRWAVPVEAERVAKEVLKEEGTPLEKERRLNRARWDFLKECLVGHSFDEESLVVYYFQLRILEREALFDKKRGKARYQEIRDTIAQTTEGG